MCTYHVDAEGRLTFVDEAWRAFARENAAPQYADTAVLYGAPLLSFISDSTTRHIYAILMDRVRREQVRIRVPFRCDAPALRRWLELDMSPGPANGVAFVSRTLRTEAREPVPSFTSSRAETESMIRMCSWCRKVETQASRWVEVEQAVEQLELFAAAEPPVVTHGICPACVERFEHGGGVAIEPV